LDLLYDLILILILIYLLTAIGLSPGGSTHLHTNNTQNNTNNNQTIQITNNVEECGPCPVFASFTLAFALQLRKKHRKTSVRIRQTSVRLIKTSVNVQYTYYQNTHTLQNTHTHTLQNNIKTTTVQINPLKPELNPICYLLALLGAHHFLHVSRIRVKL